jgi:hypothetical protein
MVVGANGLSDMIQILDCFFSPSNLFRIIHFPSQTQLQSSPQQLLLYSSRICLLSRRQEVRLTQSQRSNTVLKMNLPMMKSRSPRLRSNRIHQRSIGTSQKGKSIPRSTTIKLLTKLTLLRLLEHVGDLPIELRERIYHFTVMTWDKGTDAVTYMSGESPLFARRNISPLPTSETHLVNIFRRDLDKDEGEGSSLSLMEIRKKRYEARKDDGHIVQAFEVDNYLHTLVHRAGMHDFFQTLRV